MPGDDRLVRELQRRLLRHVQRRHLVGEVADRDAERAVVAEIGRVDAHRAAAVAVGVEGDAGARTDFLEACRSAGCGTRRFCTVSLETTRSGQPSPSRSTGATPSDLAIGTPVAGFVTCTPALRRHVGEVSAAVVPVQIRKGAFEGARRSIGAAEPDEPEILLQVDRLRPPHVVADEQIEVRRRGRSRTTSRTCSIGRPAGRRRPLRSRP